MTLVEVYGEWVKMGVGEGEGRSVWLGVVEKDRALLAVTPLREALEEAVEVGIRTVWVAANGVADPMGVEQGKEEGVIVGVPDPLCDSVALPTDGDPSAEGVSCSPPPPPMEDVGPSPVPEGVPDPPLPLQLGSVEGVKVERRGGDKEGV